MNVTVPTNIPEGTFWLFGVTLAVHVCTQIAYLAVVRYWWVKAKRRRGLVLE